MWSWALFCCALLACFIHGFFIRRMGAVVFWTPKKLTPNHKQPGVSVIVCAKNEARRIDRLIPSILDQNYPDFELLVVDDHSSDDSQEVIMRWQNKDPRVRYICYSDSREIVQGKKAALSYGIDQATHDILLLTDADCLPSSRDWVALMTAPLIEGKSIALGYGGYLKKSGILNALIRFETSLTAGLYLGLAIAGRPYMGVGRNMAYRKDFFFAQNGFKSHQHIPSGDDDLLVNHGANADNTAVVIDPRAYTWSEPKESWSSLFRQKRRHQSTAHFYSKSSKLTLSLYSGSILLFYMSVAFMGLVLSVDNFVLWGLWTLIVARWAYLIGQLSPIFRKFQTTDLPLWTPLLEPLLICLQLIIFARNRISKPTHWN